MEFFCHAIRRVTYLLVMPRKLHAEETENRELGFHVLLK